MNRKSILLSLFLIVNYHFLGTASELPVIFPFPQEMEIFDKRFEFDENTGIIVPQFARENDMKLAYLIVIELSGRYGAAP